MIILGIILIIYAFSSIFLDFASFVSVLAIPTGVFAIVYGNRNKQARVIYNTVQGKDFVGKDLRDIESVIGVHTSVNISNDNKRIYIWEDYLELLCNKDNVCIEVLKDMVNGR